MGERHGRDVSRNGVRAWDGVITLIRPADNTPSTSLCVKEPREVARRFVGNGDSE